MENIKLLKKISRIFIKLFFLPLSLILLVVLLILSPYKIIKICRIPMRFGHLIGNTEIYLSYKSFLKKKEIILFFFSKPAVNKFVEKLIKRKMIVLPEKVMHNIYLILEYLKKFNFFSKHLFDLRKYDRDLDNILIKNEINLKLNNNEDKEGYEYLEKIGLSKDDKFACLINRESEYLKNIKLDYKAQEYRNSKIENYKIACEEILKKGYYIFRMGKNVKKFNISDPKFIDYANSKFRSDFLDIFLASKCEFAFGNSDGWILAPITFRKPLALANWVPAGIPYLHSSNLIYLFKHYYDKKEKKNLSLKKIFNYKLAFLTNFNKFGDRFILKDNTPEEIKDLVLELVLKLENKWQKKENDNNLIKNFSKIIKQNSKSEIWSLEKNHKLHNEILGSYSMTFLRKNNLWVE